MNRTLPLVSRPGFNAHMRFAFLLGAIVCLVMGTMLGIGAYEATLSPTYTGPVDAIAVLFGLSAWCVVAAGALLCAAHEANERAKG